MEADSFHAGARVLRGTSGIFTGGADGFHHQDGLEARDAERADAARQRQGQAALLPRRQSSHRVIAAPENDHVRQRLSQEFFGWLMRNWILLMIIGVVLIALCATMLCVSFLACFAMIKHGDEPCDQPMRYYLLVAVCWSQVPGQLQRNIVGEGWSMNRRLALTLALSVPGWCINAWGIYMLCHAKTCPQTNPGLFNPTRLYICFSCGFAAVSLVTVVLASVFMRRLMLYMSTLEAGPGCADAVHALPKIPAGAEELVAEDGEVLGCPICMEPLAGAARTPCNHCFHEECLAKWCEKHLDCPLCRTQVGEPDVDQPHGGALN